METIMTRRNIEILRQFICLNVAFFGYLNKMLMVILMEHIGEHTRYIQHISYIILISAFLHLIWYIGVQYYYSQSDSMFVINIFKWLFVEIILSICLIMFCGIWINGWVPAMAQQAQDTIIMGRLNIYSYLLLMFLIVYFSLIMLTSIRYLINKTVFYAGNRINRRWLNE